MILRLGLKRVTQVWILAAITVGMVTLATLAVLTGWLIGNLPNRQVSSGQQVTPEARLAEIQRQMWEITVRGVREKRLPMREELAALLRLSADNYELIIFLHGSDEQKKEAVQTILLIAANITEMEGIRFRAVPPAPDGAVRAPEFPRAPRF